MFEKIVVPLDGSNAGESPLPYIAEIASRFGSRIILTRVCNSYDPNELSQGRAYLKDASKKMRQQLEEWQARSETEVTYELKVGMPAVEIIDYASQILCDLIAIASRGESGERPWPLGNVAAKVLRSSSFPILLIRKPAGEKEIKDRKLIRKILVPLDGSKTGEAAIPLASALSLKLPAELVLFQVIVPSKYLLFSDGLANLSALNQYQETAVNVAREYLNKKKEFLESKGNDVSIATVVGYPAESILDYAKANDVGLIAMPTHGLSGIGRWVFGSVTDKVLHAGDTPVIVVRSKPAEV